MSNNWCDEVWLLIDSLTFGGIETHVVELAHGLKQANVSVKVLLLRRYQQQSLVADKLSDAKIQVEFLDTEGHYFHTLLSRIRQQPPTVIHCHGYKASLIGKAMRLLTSVAQISTYHAGETPTGKVWLYDLFDRYSAFISCHSIAVSNKVAAKVKAKAVVFNNFVSVDSTQPADGEQIAFVGRLSYEKAPDRFIELAQLNPALSFDVYGSGPMENELQACCVNNVCFHGHQSHMDSIWPSIGLLIICSRFEGLPMTALEAMSRGIVVISLDVGNMSQLIEHRRNGYIVSSMAQLQQSIHQYLSLTPTERQSLKDNAITTVNHHYSPQAVIPQIRQLYSC
ncbi:glycosyltransferase [Vibrio sp. NH-UV-68]|uniref:glycosyltransferase family 4 protein n=1 Tax=unclassified Vibrio TaxID=2614977 RepID=UPI0036F2A619